MIIVKDFIPGMSLAAAVDCVLSSWPMGKKCNIAELDEGSLALQIDSDGLSPCDVGFTLAFNDIAKPE